LTPLALVEHLDVSAQRYRGNHPFGLVSPHAPFQQRRAEAHREPQHLHTRQARDQIMSELVKNDQDSEGYDEGRDGR
jgi:hypothetical protein